MAWVALIALLLGPQLVACNDNTWREISATGDVPTARVFMSAVYSSTHKKIYAFGGGNTCCTSQYNHGELLEYDVVNESWQNISAENIPRKRHAYGMAFVPPESIYIFGGFTNLGLWDDMHVYNISGNAFTNLSNDNPPTGIGPQRVAFSTLVYAPMSTTAATDDEQLLLFGGMRENEETGAQFWSDDFWSYNIASNHWTELNPAGKPSSRIGHGVVFVNSLGVEYLVVFGGYQTSSWPYFMNDMHAYDIAAGTWSVRTSSGPGMPAGRWGFGISIIPYMEEDQIAIFGGQAYEYSNRVYKNDLWAYSMMYSFWTYMIATNSHPSGRFGMAFPRAPYDAEGGIQDQIFAIVGGDKDSPKEDIMYSYAVPIPTTTTSTSTTQTTESATSSTATSSTATSSTATSSTVTSLTTTSETITKTTSTSSSKTGTSSTVTSSTATTETTSISSISSTTSISSTGSISSTTSGTSTATTETTSETSTATTTSISSTSSISSTISTTSETSTATTETVSSTSASSTSSVSTSVTSKTSSSTTITTSTSNTSSQTTETITSTSSTYTSSTDTTETLTSTSATATTSTESTVTSTETTLTSTSASTKTSTTSSTTNSSSITSSLTTSSWTTGSSSTSITTTYSATITSNSSTTKTSSTAFSVADGSSLATGGFDESGTTTSGLGESALDSNATTSGSDESGTTSLAALPNSTGEATSTSSMASSATSTGTSTNTRSATSTITSITESATTTTLTTTWMTSTTRTLHFGILMGGGLDAPTGTTSFDMELQMDATKFNENEFKASVLAAADSPVNAQVEIDSIAYHVDVQYSFEGTVTSEQATSSVATAASVDESQVTVTLSNIRRLDEHEVSEEVLSELLEFYVASDFPQLSFPRRRGEDGRRLATTVDARISTANQSHVETITTGVADPSKVQQAMEASGVSSTVTLAKAPTHTVKVSTRIVSGTSAPVALPDSMTLQAKLSDGLGTEVGVTVANIEEVSSAVESVVSPLLWGIIILSSCWTRH